MKKTGLLFVLTLMLSCVFISCFTKDEPDEGNVTIVGTWYMQGTKYFVFNNDGTGEMLGAVGGNTTFVPMTWKLNGNDLTVTISYSGIEPLGFKVLSLNAQTLVLEFTEISDGEIETIEMTYTRN